MWEAASFDDLDSAINGGAPVRIGELVDRMGEGKRMGWKGTKAVVGRGTFATTDVDSSFTFTSADGPLASVANCSNVRRYSTTLV